MIGRMTWPPILVLAIARNCVGTFTLAVCITCCVTLRQIFIMPSVAMNAGNFCLAIRKPDTPPSAQPIRMQAMMPMMNAGTPVMPILVSRPVG